MSQAPNNLSEDPSQLSTQQKIELFEKSSDKNENYKPLTFFNNFAAPASYQKWNLSSSDNNASSNVTNSAVHNTSTPLSSGISFPVYRQKTSDKPTPKKSNSSLPSHHIPHSYQNKLTASRTIDDRKSTISYYNSLDTKAEDSSINMKEFHEAIKDLDTFLARELNEIEIEKRIGLSKHENFKRESIKDHNARYEEKILEALHKLKEEINEIKENQKDFETKIRKQENYQYIKLNERMNEEYGRNQRISKTTSNPEKVLMHQTSKTSNNPEGIYKQYVSKTSSNPSGVLKHKSSGSSIEKKSISSEKKSSPKIENKQNHKKNFESPILASSGYSREERIRKLEAEIYKEETLMMKINRVLENLRNVDDRNLIDIINIERHYLVASTRFQSALSEIRKLNENIELPHLPPYNRKGKLLIRDIMLEVKASYFDRPLPLKNEFLLVLMKYEDKVFASKPMRIIDDVRIIKFTEKFSIPEIYMDFDMRLEIYGTTFWRKNATVRETMLKKYGFITFSLADTGNKLKRFQMIEVLQSENVPIRNKVMMKISQKITTDVQYRGNLFVKLRDVWHEASAHLNGHLLEISFKKIYNSGVSRSQETMLLDLYNVDSDAVIPVDVRRISDKPYTFLLKFNHYVDVANFYLMVAAESSETFSEWISALNKVLVLIK